MHTVHKYTTHKYTHTCTVAVCAPEQKVYDIARAEISCKDTNVVKQVLTLLVNDPGVTVRRIKNRLGEPHLPSLTSPLKPSPKPSCIIVCIMLNNVM